MPRKKYMGKEPKEAPIPPLSKEEKEELRKQKPKFDPKQPTPLAGGGIAAGIRRFNRGGKV
jgi:hypothetical protein